MWPEVWQGVKRHLTLMELNWGTDTTPDQIQYILPPVTLCAPWAPERWWLYLSDRRFDHLPRTPSAPGPPLAEPHSPERGPWGASLWLVWQKFTIDVLKKSHQWWCVVRTAVRDKPSLFTISRSCKTKKICSQLSENITEIQNIVIWKLTNSRLQNAYFPET